MRMERGYKSLSFAVYPTHIRNVLVSCERYARNNPLVSLHDLARGKCEKFADALAPASCFTDAVTRQDSTSVLISKGAFENLA